MQEESLSALCMVLVATGTVYAGAVRASSAQRALREETGEPTPSIDARSALFLPVAASASLLIMFFLFTYLQSFIVLYIVAVSTVSVAFCVQPLVVSMCHATPARAYTGCVLSAVTIGLWLHTGHWVLNNVLGVCLCVSIISLIRLPSLKVAVLVLVALFFYDIFWVFFSEGIFGKNVMVEVATKSAANPVRAAAEALHIPVAKEAVRQLQLPVKLLFPSRDSDGFPIFSMLGLGDIALPGIFLAFARRVDESLARKKDTDAAIEMSEMGRLLSSGGGSSSSSGAAETGHGGSVGWLSPYLKFSLAGYVLGIVCSIAASRIYNLAQPALLYIVPCVLCPLIWRAKRMSQLRIIWHGVEGDDDASGGGGGGGGGGGDDESSQARRDD